MRVYTFEMILIFTMNNSKGHIPSMLAMGELYYYGARGMPRDQPLALQYFEQAANAGDPSGMCGAAGMYLKGEGVSKNVSHAVTLYENASSMGSVRALNGLGYIYFHGQALPQNHTKAYYYFLAAAETLTDGDALFNAAFLLDNGLGVERDTTKALNFYQIGAKQFGHFGCVSSLGSMYMEVILYCAPLQAA